MTEPSLQPERVIPPDNALAASGKISEIHNITLKAALKIVREQIDRDQSRDHK
jgi:hypothetical protein